MGKSWSVQHCSLCVAMKKAALGLLVGEHFLRCSDACGMCLLVGVIAGAHHGTDGGVGEAHLVGLLLEHLEGVGVHITAHGQVAVGAARVVRRSSCQS